MANTMRQTLHESWSEKHKKHNKEFIGFSEMIWTTHDKGEILIKDMNDEHLINAIRMIDRGSTYDHRELLPHQSGMYNELITETQNRKILPANYGDWDD